MLEISTGISFTNQTLLRLIQKDMFKSFFDQYFQSHKQYLLSVLQDSKAWSRKRDFSSSPIEKSPADLSRGWEKNTSHHSYRVPLFPSHHYYLVPGIAHDLVPCMTQLFIGTHT